MGAPSRRASFRDPAAAQAGGYVLAVAGVLIAAGLAFHPLPAGGFEEQPGVLADAPLWRAAHVAIAGGFVLCALGGLLQLFAGGRPDQWTGRLSWGAVTVGMLFFTEVALVNGWVMHPLGAAVNARDREARLLFETFNRLPAGYGWLGNPLFLAGLIGLAATEVQTRPVGAVGLPRWLAWLGLVSALLSRLRGVGSATGRYFLEPFVLANIPAFLWLGACGLALASFAQGSRAPGIVRVYADLPRP